MTRHHNSMGMSVGRSDALGFLDRHKELDEYPKIKQIDNDYIRRTRRRPWSTSALLLSGGLEK